LVAHPSSVTDRGDRTTCEAGAPLPRELPPRLRRHFAETSGHCSPFTYSIGLSSPLAEHASDGRSYPLALPLLPEVEEELARQLTLEHESVHLAQYVSTSFGLRTLRRTNIALRYLAELTPIKLPVLQTIWHEVTTSGSEPHAKALARMLVFLDSADQMRLHRYDIPPELLSDDPEREGQDTLEISWEPWTPLFFTDATTDLLSRRKLAPTLSVQIMHQPHLILQSGRRGQRVVINAAALMESFAIVVECNLLKNALGDEGPAAVVEYLDNIESDEGTGYIACATYAVSAGACSGPYVIDMFAILVDVALMYDPFVLFNAPSFDLPTEDQHSDQLPGETFVRACRVARDLPPVTSNDPDDLSRFYRSLCRGMGIPSPEWMAETAAESAAELLARSGGAASNILLSQAFFMHDAALRVRAQRPTTLPIEFLQGSGIVDVLSAGFPYISFYNLKSGAAEELREKNTKLVSIHGMVWLALTESELHCPLAIGEPFFCPSAGRGEAACPRDDCFVAGVARVRDGVLESLDVTMRA
jgi:hypothetical protein